MTKQWTVADMPNLSGKKVVVTGANSGVGYEAARAFAEKGAHVVFACRSRGRAEEAVDELRQQEPEVSVEIIILDLADLVYMKVWTPIHAFPISASSPAIRNRYTHTTPLVSSSKAFLVASMPTSNHLPTDRCRHSPYPRTTSDLI